MCFSATASFAAAFLIAPAGLYSLSRTAGAPRNWPVASVPLLFAAQQALEGGLWLSLGGRWPASLAGPLANGFIVIALVVWPIFVPLACRLIEDDSRRRRAMTVLLILGVIVAGYGAVDTGLRPYDARIVGRSLCYVNNSPYPPALMVAYLAAVLGPLLLSSAKALRALGAIAGIGLAASLTLWFADFLSVWCFFAALASLALATHFAPRLQLLQR